MSDDPNPTPDPVEPPEQGLTEGELEGIITRVVDSRLAPVQESITKIQPIDVDALRGGILEDVTNLLSSHTGSQVDEGKLTQSISSLLDSKLKGIGVRAGRNPGPLAKWLGWNA